MVKRSKPSAADLHLHPELSRFMVFMRRGAHVQESEADVRESEADVGSGKDELPVWKQQPNTGEHHR